MNRLQWDPERYDYVCQFSTWVRPGKRTPPSVKFPLVPSFLWETQEKVLFRGTWWGPFSKAKQSGKLPTTSVNTCFGVQRVQFGMCLKVVHTLK